MTSASGSQRRRPGRPRGGPWREPEARDRVAGPSRFARPPRADRLPRLRGSVRYRSCDFPSFRRTNIGRIAAQSRKESSQCRRRPCFSRAHDLQSIGICAAFIGATATFVVAINPTINFQPLLNSTYCYFRVHSESAATRTASSGKNMKDLLHVAVGGCYCLLRTAAILTRA